MKNERVRSSLSLNKAADDPAIKVIVAQSISSPID